jgi:hypothetical protein
VRPYDFLYCIGDSYTYAHEQADDLLSEVTLANRWSRLVADHYGLPEVNKGVAGQNNQWIARTLQNDMIQYQKENKNPLVIVLWSDPSRLEVWDRSQNTTDTFNQDHKAYKDFIIDHFDFEYNSLIAEYHSRAMRFMLDYMNIDFIEAETPWCEWRTVDKDTLLFSNETKKVGMFNNGKGHLNVKGNKLFAEQIIQKYDNKTQ